VGIPIFFSSNDNYIPYVSVMMQSIMENSKRGRKYEFYILNIDIKNETMEKLQKQVSAFLDFSLNFVDMSPYTKDYDFFISRHVTAETYFRLFIPYIFPDIEKVLYLDGDMVCLTDVSLLFDTDISNYLAAGVRDPALPLYYTPKRKRDPILADICEVLLSMENPENYINAGTLLFNCKKFRETYSLKYVTDTIFSRKWKVHDQDIINVLAKDKILIVDKSWNCYIPFVDVKYLPQKYLPEHSQAQKNPKILHYKPYSVWYHIPYFYEFWKYATRTPFCYEIVTRMNKNETAFDRKLCDRVCYTIRTRTGFGGAALLKTIIAFFTRKPRNKG